MCEMSNSPAAVRTARCSSMMPVYCTGMSQPPNGTMRAPRATCQSYSGVRRFSLMAVVCKEGGAAPSRGAAPVPSLWRSHALIVHAVPHNPRGEAGYYPPIAGILRPCLPTFRSFRSTAGSIPTPPR